MGNVLKVKDKKTNKWIDIPAIQGRSAYEIAVDGGFKGTEEEFAKALTGVALDGEHITNTNNPHKVTADQTGALPITGGTINGGLSVNGWLTSNILSMNPEYYNEPIEIGQYIDFHKKGTTNDFDARLGIADDNLKLYLKGVGNFDLYGTHNKPTASDVGALSKTIYIENKDILAIVDDGWYYGVSTENVPTDNRAGYIRVMTKKGEHLHYRVVYWRPHNSTTEYVNVLNGIKETGEDNWLGWTETFTNQSNVLKKPLSIESDNPHVTLANNNENYASIYKHASLAKQYDYGTLIRDSNEKLSNDNFLDLRVQHNQAKNGNKNGCLSLYYHQDNVSTEYNIFGSHNKPTGSYEGNRDWYGSSSQLTRTIETGGIGDCLLVWNDSTSGHMFLIITPRGGFGLNANGGLNSTVGTQCTFKDGKLTFNGSSIPLNTQGVIYHYQVL